MKRLTQCTCLCIAVLLLPGCDFDNTIPEEPTAESVDGDYERGPNGGRLLQKSNFEVVYK